MSGWAWGCGTHCLTYCFMAVPNFFLFSKLHSCSLKLLTMSRPQTTVSSTASSSPPPSADLLPPMSRSSNVSVLRSLRPYTSYRQSFTFLCGNASENISSPTPTTQHTLAPKSKVSKIEYTSIFRACQVKSIVYI